MATLSLRDFTLNQTNITGKRNPVVTLDALKKRYKIDPVTRQRTEELDGYVCDIVARNRVQSVKLPIDAISSSLFDEITEALTANKIVNANFGANGSTLRGKCYALINQQGALMSGISCTATEFNLVSIDEPELDDFDDDEVLI